MIRARLSAQRALLGEVSPSLRAVVLELDGDRLEVRCYFDGPVSAGDEESMSSVEAEVMADAEQGEIVGLRCIRLDAPASIDDGGVWVYLRREDGAS